MAKYWQIIKNTWAEYSVYRLNFLIWRLRSFISFATIYFFWWAVFGENQQIFGWQESGILTYILGTSLLSDIIFSSRTVDVGGEINQGNLTNFLLKPLSFFKFWFARDLADKLLNFICTLVEIAIFLSILKPVLFFQTNPFYLLIFVLAIILATFLYFYVNLLLGLIAFWTPESWSGIWAPRFVFTVILGFFAGQIFPLDILPKQIFNFLQLTPFPYFIYFPLRIYLGRITVSEIFIGLTMSLLWVGIGYLMAKKLWLAGLKVYGAEGR